MTGYRPSRVLANVRTGAGTEVRNNTRTNTHTNTHTRSNLQPRASRSTIHSCFGSFLKCHTRCVPAITFR